MDKTRSLSEAAGFHIDPTLNCLKPFGCTEPTMWCDWWRLHRDNLASGATYWWEAGHPIIDCVTPVNRLHPAVILSDAQFKLSNQQSGHLIGPEESEIVSRLPGKPEIKTLKMTQNKCDFFPPESWITRKRCERCVCVSCRSADVHINTQGFHLVSPDQWVHSSSSAAFHLHQQL